ncbi:hypothetical protein ACFOWM_13480 [Ferruginibacter yonginensis]|uniref:Uncharacterized protein n=1 Tax=Ferruginibacter yonginensis TaxID=1310416 RepID=A0ABV8QXU5_9BACT
MAPNNNAVTTISLGQINTSLTGKNTLYLDAASLFDKNLHGPVKQILGTFVNEETLPNSAYIYIKKNEGFVKGEFDVVETVSGKIYLSPKNLKGVGNSLFGRNIINGINGFSDNIATILSQRGLSLNDFKLLQQKRYDLMTIVEKAHIDAIRNSIPIPDGNTLLQKVIPKNQIQSFIDVPNDNFRKVGGFVSTAKDAKHLNTFEDVYQGMRLDYPGTQFNLSDGSFGVIRYKTPTPNLTVPKLPEVTGDLPYTGNGFTGGNNGKLGTPEWKPPYNTPTEGSELWEVFSDGTEVLRAKISTAQNKFIPVP